MTFLRSRPWIFAASVAALAACATLAARNKSAGDEEVIRLPHQKHQAAEVDCRACHSAIYSSTSLEGRQLPKEKTCLKCHADWKSEGQCGTCHLTAKPETYPARERVVHFSHAQHLPLTEEKCARCHPALPEPNVENVKTSPSMAVCLECHNHKVEYDDGRCQPCHVDLTRVPLRPVADYTHQGDFLKRHMLPARTSPGVCAQCHEQTFCQDCHAQTVSTQVEFKYPEMVDRQFVHRNDYIDRHQIEANANETLCKRCHGNSFCINCHRQQNLTLTAANPLNPHPAGWMIPSSNDFHGPSARQDIVSCAGCHDQGINTNCVRCHTVGGPGGNPHPPGFLSSHDRDDQRKSRPCGFCHTTT